MRGFVVLLFCCLLVNVSALSLTVHVPEKYTDVVSGERLYFDVEIKYPENPLRKDLRLEYSVLNEAGEVVLESKAIKAVETQASFIDFVVIPESLETGRYEIVVNVRDYESLSEEISASFYVKGSVNDQIVTYLIIILVSIILIGILIVVGLFRK